MHFFLMALMCWQLATDPTTNPTPQPATPQPATTQPTTAQPTTPQPATLQPVTPQPATAQQRSAQTAETKPAETKPAETKPVETKPAPPLAGLPEPSTPIVAYNIEARLNPKAHTVQGQLTLTYTNQAPDIISELQFHAYLNASLNNASTYAQDGGESAAPASDNNRYGYMQIESCSIDGQDAMARLTYIQALDATPEDRTVFSIPLTEPLMPGESLQINFHFKARLPLSWNRAGYLDEFFFVAQWFPKIGVWESRGQRGRTEPGWNCHAPHGHTEFYADFGTYDVALTLPNQFKLGATGAQQGEPHIGANETTYHYHQERVHDFAWVAWPQFERRTRIFELDPKLQADALKHYATQFDVPQSALIPHQIEMVLLIAQDHVGQTERHFRAMTEALTFSALRLMPYPYDTITMVDIPYGADFAGGMEYPTMIALGTKFHNPSQNLDLERLIYHEFMHEYFYGLVATNEFEESWMDEGFTSYFETKLVDTLHPDSVDYTWIPPSLLLPQPFGWAWAEDFPILNRISLAVPNPEAYFPGKPATRAQLTRSNALKEVGHSPIASLAWRYLDYGRNAYDKPSTMLLQLENELGVAVVEKILFTYVRRWAYGHPGEADFISVAEEVAGQKLDWFFQPLLHGSGPLDFSVAMPTSQPLDLQGLDVGTAGIVAVQDNDEHKGFRNRVTVLKNGAQTYPVDVLIRFTDGTERRERWSGDTPWIRYQLDTPTRVESVEVDPLDKVCMDTNRFNNSYVVSRDQTTSRGYKARLILFVQNILQSLVGGF